MSKESFANSIITKLKSSVGINGSVYTSASSLSAQTAIAEAITEYLIANTTITISYDGVLNSGGADVIASDTMKIAGTCMLATRPTDFDTWIATLQSSISSAFLVEPPSTQGVLTSFQPFNNTAGALQISQSDVKSVHESNLSNPTLSVWSVICAGILKWLNSNAGKNPSAVAITASRSGVSSGTATLLSINVT